MTPTDRTETIVTEQPVAGTAVPASAQTHTTVIERRSGGGSGLMMAIVLLVLAVGGFFAFQFMKQGEVRTDAVAGAAGEVGNAAQKVGDAAQEAAKKIGE